MFYWCISKKHHLIINSGLIFRLYYIFFLSFSVNSFILFPVWLCNILLPVIKSPEKSIWGNVKNLYFNLSSSSLTFLGYNHVQKQKDFLVFPDRLTRLCRNCEAKLNLWNCSVLAAEQMFWEVMQLRREMSYAKLGYYKDHLWCSDQRVPPTHFLALVPLLCVSHSWMREGKTVFVPGNTAEWTGSLPDRALGSVRFVFFL